MPKLQKIAAIYIVKPEFCTLLCQELNGDFEVFGDVVLSSQQKRDVCFAQDIWLEPQRVTIESISDAANVLRQAGKYWSLHPVSHIRRARLIEAQLRHCPPLDRHFPIETALPVVGGFSLLDKNTLIYSMKRLKVWPEGRCYFIEDKINPPNRAYLKLWEALTLLGRYPQAGDLVLDLGASPGGWTYVMQSLGAEVTAVDKALLDPRIAQRPGVTFLQHSAFAMDPETLDKTYDWVLSDIACYPDRALVLIKKWIASGQAKQLIVTIKLQGDIELSTLKPFQDIPCSRVINLYHNKHEATFFYPA